MGRGARRPRRRPRAGGGGGGERIGPLPRLRPGADPSGGGGGCCGPEPGRPGGDPPRRRLGEQALSGRPLGAGGGGDRALDRPSGRGIRAARAKRPWPSRWSRRAEGSPPEPMPPTCPGWSALLGGARPGPRRRHRPPPPGARPRRADPLPARADRPQDPRTVRSPRAGAAWSADRTAGPARSNHRGGSAAAVDIPEAVVVERALALIGEPRPPGSAGGPV